jgi:hypothetical protein
VDRPLRTPGSVAGPHPVRSAVGDELDVAVEVGAEDSDPALGGQGGQRFRGRMAVLVVDAGRDHRDAGPRRSHEGGRRRRVGAVVADLEQIDGWDRPAGQQRGFDGRFGVAGEDRGEAAVADEHHHRPIVDVALGQR